MAMVQAEQAEQFDILVLGGGKGGKTLAIDQAKSGRRVAMVEAAMIGGSCINVACIPSKALIKSAEIANDVAKASEFGTKVSGVETDMPGVAARTASIVAERVGSNRKAFTASGLDLVMGWGRFVQARVIEAMTESGPRRLTADRIYLDLGTRAAIPAIPGLSAAEPLTHVEALKLKSAPSHLLVLGGGYIGLEMAQAFRRLGSEVTIIERGRAIAAREDEDVILAITEMFEDVGVRIATNVSAARVRGRSGEHVVVEAADGRAFSGSHLLVAAGRTPMTNGIGLEIAGVALDAKGFIMVDHRLRTSADGIWALGEVAGTPMFTHAALDDFRVVKSQIEGGSRTTSGRLIPSCLFLDPEFARVGLSEKQARMQGIRYRFAKLPMHAVARARTMSSLRGFMKCLIADDSDRIIGFAMFGERAGEVMATVQIAMLGGLPFPLLGDAILAHPTIAEGFNTLFERIEPCDI